MLPLVSESLVKQYRQALARSPELSTRLLVLATAGNFSAREAVNGHRGYYLSYGDMWFSRSANDIIGEMGYTLEQGKINNLVSFASGSIDLWSYLSLLPREYRTTLGDEWANFILGPLAAALKLQKLGFEDRETVIHTGGVFMLLEAMALELVPSGKRKNLYEALLARFNAEVIRHHGYISESSARLAFYTILVDVLAPIFDEASGDELGSMILKALADNPKQAAEAKDDPKIVGWLMGQVMRASPVKLDPNTVRAAILERL